jgi:hypothetical protein
MIASSSVSSFYRGTSVRRGMPRLAVNRCIWCDSEIAESRQDRDMNCLQSSSTEPSRRSRASSPIGLSVSGGPKRIWTSWTKRVQLGGPLLSSNRWNQS